MKEVKEEAETNAKEQNEHNRAAAWLQTSSVG